MSSGFASCVSAVRKIASSTTHSATSAPCHAIGKPLHSILAEQGIAKGPSKAWLDSIEQRRKHDLELKRREADQALRASRIAELERDTAALTAGQLPPPPPPPLELNVQPSQEARVDAEPRALGEQEQGLKQTEHKHTAQEDESMSSGRSADVAGMIGPDEAPMEEEMSEASMQDVLVDVNDAAC